MQAGDLSGAGTAATRPLRIAWSGESGQPGVGGVKGIAYMLLRGLADRGHTVEVFGPHEAVDLLAGLPSTVSVHSRPVRWHWGRWYTSGRLRMFLSSSLLRILLQRRLADDILRRHAQEPFDVIFQMSQFESFFRGRRRCDPPLVVHPCTIARLEWEWYRAERGLTADRGRSPKSRFVSLMLRTRALLQTPHSRRPDVVVGPSHVFLADLQRVFGLPADRLAVLRHPVQLLPSPALSPLVKPAELLFISRMSSRKGVELIVALSHRLDDLSGRAHISLIGGATLWSDYSPLLAGLNPRIAEYRGELPHAEVDALLATAAGLLVPSRFEPGSIVTGEALGRGVPVIASTAVGPSDLLRGGAGRVFADGDLDGLEAATRDLLEAIAADRDQVAAQAREVAEEHLTGDVVAHELERILRVAAASAIPVSQAPAHAVGAHEPTSHHADLRTT